ncbi:MAG TPA: helix-turn-helix domain-containing protein [Tepidisphaeraceae bacterium]|nr:helix-turn-helix domain-containing protein [Tepidisphaeraceae bacterium]
MKLHANAALTVSQRQEVRRLHEQEGLGTRKLARRFHVSTRTIHRWIHRDSPQDRSSVPHHRHTCITPDYQHAVITYRQAHPHHGPMRIAAELATQFPQARRGTVWTILRQHQLSQRAPAAPRSPKPIPVGHHRIQMDVQQLPAIQGGHGFEYKITAIHLRTRCKYSEIHPTHDATTVAAVLQRALDRLPPFSWSGPTTLGSSR